MHTISKKLKSVDDPQLIRLMVGSHRYDSKLRLGIPEAIRYEKEVGDLIGNGVPDKHKTVGQIFPEENVLKVYFILFPYAEQLWLEYIKDNGDNKNFSVAFCFISESLANLISEKGMVSAVNDTFIITEMILSDGTTDAAQMVIDYFLETFPNFLAYKEINMSSLSPYIQERTRIWLDEIDRFWNEVEKFYERKYISK